MAPPANVLVLISVKPASLNHPFSIATICGAKTGSFPKPKANLLTSGADCAQAVLDIAGAASAAVAIPVCAINDRLSILSPLNFDSTLVLIPTSTNKFFQ